MTSSLTLRAGRLAAVFVFLLATVTALVEPARAESTCTSSEGLKPVGEGEKRLRHQMPVVFVHGILSDHMTWNQPGEEASEWFSQRVADIPHISAWLFDYKKAQPQWVTDPRIGPALGKAISCLAHTSGLKVTVIAHSQGGLATQFAVSQPDPRGKGKVADLVAEVNTIGTPFRGSPLVSASHEMVRPVLESVRAWCVGRRGAAAELCAWPGSPQGSALQHGSPEIKALPPWPDALPVHNTAGDIRITGRQPWVGKKTVSVGDLAVPLASATAHHTAPGKPAVFTCDFSYSWIDLLRPGAKAARLTYEILVSPCTHTGVKNYAKVTDRLVSRVSEVQRAQTPTLAYATENDVRLWVAGDSRVLAKIPKGATVRSLSWSSSGEHLAWTTQRDGLPEKVFLTATDPTSAPVRSWTCPDCTQIAFLGEQLVASTLTDPLTNALTTFPADGSKPRARKLTGLPTLDPEDCHASRCGIDLLSGTRSGGIVVAHYAGGGGNFGGPGRLYVVDDDNEANHLVSPQGSAHDSTVAPAVSPTGNKLAYGTFVHISACEEYTQPTIVDLDEGRATTPDLPAGPGNPRLVSTWFDRGGTAYATFRSEPGCDTETAWEGLRTFRAEGGRWQQVNSGHEVLAQAHHPGGRIATLTGTREEENVLRGVLEARTALGKTVNVGRNVHSFAWSPR